LFLQTILLVKNVDLSILNKRGEALKEAGVADLAPEVFYENHFNATCANKIEKSCGSQNPGHGT
jgi:hypothetical protein